MTAVNLRSVDLNLLVVLDALLEERSATRAAARLHVTQSAVSNALARLRSLFDDPLLVRTPHGFTLTARATQLAPELSRLLHQTSSLLAPAAQAAPDRTFTIACTDAVGVVLLPALLPRLGSRRLRFVSLDYEIGSSGLQTGDVDLLIGLPPTTPRGCRGELVYEDALQCVVRDQHPRVRRQLTLTTYAALSHVEVALFGRADERVDRALARKGLTRTIALLVSHFSSIPVAIAASDHVAVLSERLAHAYAQPFGLRVFPPPLRLPPLKVQQYWHRRAEHDPALSELRRAIREAAHSPPATDRAQGPRSRPAARSPKPGA